MLWRLRCKIMKLLGLRYEFIDSAGTRHIHDRSVGRCFCQLSEFKKRRIWETAGFSEREIEIAARAQRARNVDGKQ